MKINYPIDDVLKVLRMNLEDHQKDLQEAIEGWIAQVQEAVLDLSKSLTRDGIKANTVKLGQLFYSRPKDVRLEYAKYLGMLDRARKHGVTTVELDDDEYDRLYNDNWDWAQSAKTSNSSYSNKHR